MSEGATIPPPTPIAALSPSLQRPSGSCQTCGSSLPTGSAPMGQSQYVLGIGKVRITYPSESVEKHFAQVIGRHDSKGHVATDLQRLRDVMRKPESRYLARLACWTLDIMDYPAYLLYPKAESDFSLLIESLRPDSSSTIDVVAGEIKGLASAQECNGLQLPRLVFETVFILEKEQMIKQWPRPDKIPPNDFEAIAKEVFDRAMRPNKGVGLDRAKNFVFMFYGNVYGLAAQKASEGYSLVTVDVQPSPVSDPHQLATVILRFRHHQTDLTETFSCTVNLDGMFAYLASPLRATYESMVP